MPDLYITRAQPNPKGRDRTSRTTVQNAQLNEEWVEFRVDNTRNLTGDEIIHRTYDSACRMTGSESLYRFGSVSVTPGKTVRVHTGSGTDGWAGNTYHAYMGYGWYKWNNDCGDQITIAYSGTTIDYAAYGAKPREGELVRQYGANTLA